MFRHRQLQPIGRVAAANHGILHSITTVSSVETESQLLNSYTVTPPIKPWPQKLTHKRLCSIITHQQNLDLALQIFHYAGNYHPNFHHSYDTYHSIIHKLSRLRAFDPIASLLNELRNSRIKCGENLFITLIRNYGIASRPKEAIKIFLRINDFGVKRSVRSLNTLLNALVQNKKYDSVYFMFKNSQKRFEIVPNVFTCNILLKALCKKDDVEGAVKVLDEMPGMGMVPNVVSYTTIMGGYVDRGDMVGAKGVFYQILDRGWLPDATTYTVLMDGFCKLGRFVDATKVMDEMEENGVEPNDVTYSVMIEALCKEKKSGEAVNMVRDMLDKKYIPSSALCCRVIDALCREGKVEEACELWKMLLLKNCTPDNAISSTLIHWLCKEGKVWEARKLFDEFDRGSIPSVLTYNTLIAGMCDSGELCEAGRLWDDMVERGCPPNSFTYNMLIKGFCKAGHAKEGVRVLEEMLDRGCSPNESTYSVLIEALCDSGCEADISNVLDIAASCKLEINYDSWRVLVEKFVTSHANRHSPVDSSPAPKLVLYSYWQSSCSWRVRFGLNLKGLSYEYRAVNLAKWEQFTSEFGKLNPLRYVPVLVDGDVVVSDSYAILLCLEEKYPQKPLLPADPRLRAINLQAAGIVSSSIQPLHMLSLLKYVEQKMGPEEQQAWAHVHIEKGFFALEKLLKDCAGPYATGEGVYMADVFLAPQIALATKRFNVDMADVFLAPQIEVAAKRFNVDMSKFPTLGAVYESCNALPEFQASVPDRQPDAAH
ncbi:Pentatricopeptide repeat-containing protein, mitochondrial [Sesamum angolense]|uniref:glutathione transferase n=1 Tax=Sesamum angolense TaxID=2727404 RepID=A0AAE2BTP9_9LAMI|nr:Pentatricopeptide repeat-containing protein, mitochondrial [Sesamum angolense]